MRRVKLAYRTSVDHTSSLFETSGLKYFCRYQHKTPNTESNIKLWWLSCIVGNVVARF